jgi:hypothetical protein
MLKQKLREDFKRTIQKELSKEDDLGLWLAAFETLIADVEACDLEQWRKHEIFIQIGRCSHWLRPHQKRWTAAGGFAWPIGYVQKSEDHIKNSSGPIGSGLPELDWYVLLHWNREAEEWQLISPKFFGKKKLIWRVVLPARTRRHLQAAVHSLWSPDSPEQKGRKTEHFFGFRKMDGQWQCVT